MTHYERRLTEDLERIRGMLGDISARVCRSLETTIHAVGEHDEDTLHEVAINDLAVNRDVRTVDRLCHEFVARHLPAAGHLRFISSVLRIAIALERAGDYSVTISRTALQRTQAPPPAIHEQFKAMARLSCGMLKDAMRAFLEGDVKLANTTRRHDQRVDQANDEIFDALVLHGKSQDPLELATLLRMFSKVERFSDQAKNICEEAVFAVTGKMKESKTFRVLFLDERNDLVSQLAAAIARHSYPDSGVYSSAGWAAADQLHPSLEQHAKRFNLDTEQTRPTRVKQLEGFPTAFHVVVEINPGDRARLPNIPYHTILQKWELQVPADTGADLPASGLDQLERELTSRIDALIQRLRGSDANEPA